MWTRGAKELWPYDRGRSHSVPTSPCPTPVFLLSPVLICGSPDTWGAEWKHLVACLRAL
jgi:hypothetical protein